MLYRKLDSYGDRVRGKGTENFLTDSEAVAQAVKTRLFLLRGQWWENLNEGFPFFEEIVGFGGTRERIDNATRIIQERVLDTQGVLSIERIEVEERGRSLHIELEINTKFGLSAVEVTL